MDNNSCFHSTPETRDGQTLCNQRGQDRISGLFQPRGLLPAAGVADPELVSFSDGQPSEFGSGGLEALRTRLQHLFERFTVKLAVIVIEIRVQGDVAYDYGWHDVTLTPRDGGQPIRRRDRYVDIWRKNK